MSEIACYLQSTGSAYLIHRERCVCVCVGAESNYSNAVGNKDGGKRLNAVPSFQQGMSAETEISEMCQLMFSPVFIFMHLM